MPNIRIAHVGCGHWGKNLVRNFAEMGVLSAIVDADARTAKTESEKYGVSVLSFDEVLAQPDIAAISFATPAEMHFEQVLTALAAGKHVYVEKPMALTVAEGREMVEAANKLGRILMVGHLLQYHPIYRTVLKMVQEGQLGALKYVYSNRMSTGKLRTNENVLWSFLPHDISMVLGLSGTAPQSVTAQGCSWVTRGLADMVTVQMVFENGLRGHLQASWLNPAKEHKLVVIGEEGMLVFEDSKPAWEDKLLLYRHSVKQTEHGPTIEKADGEPISVPQEEPLRAECEHFVECVETGSRPRTDGEEGLAVLDVLERAEQGLAAHLSGRGA